MKKTLLLIVGYIIAITSLSAQCVVKESIRNGDFNDGYIPGDFNSELQYAQSDIDARLSSGQCFYQTGGRYYVSDNNQVYVCEGTAKQGTSFTPDFTTYGIDGSGDVLLFVDPSTGSPEIFGQTVTVFPNQTYYFSFWFNSINPPVPYFGATIDGENVSLSATNSVSFDVDLVRVRLNSDGTRIEGPNGETLRDTTNTTVQWIQYSGSWTSSTKTTVDVELRPYNDAGLTQGVPLSGVDFALDKFSLINSCQNVYGANAYVIDFEEPDTVNLCEIGGEITLDPHIPLSQQNNATITWFEGEGSSPTQLSAGNFTQVINSPGHYSVCVDDPDNACNQVENIVVIEDVDIQLNDIELCSPAQMEVDAGLDPNPAISINWTGPSGNGLGRTFTVNTEGSHSVSLTPLKGNTGCSVSKNFNVVSLLPEVDTIEYCSGSGVDVTLQINDGKSYKWSMNQDMSNPIGTGSSVDYSIPSNTNDLIEVWVQNAETSPLGTMSGPAIGSASSATSSMTTSITTYQNILIKSARMGGEAWTGDCGGSGGTSTVTVQLLDVVNGNAIISSTDVQVPCGSPGNVELNINVPAGRYRLRTSGSTNMMTTPIWSGAAPTYSIGGVIDIDSYSEHVGAFGVMEIEASDACDPVPYVLKPISCCTAPTDDPSIDIPSSTLEVCSPNTGEVISVSGLTDGLDFKWQESSDGTTFTDMSGETGVVSGGQLTLSNLSTDELWYRYILAETGNLDKTCVKTSDSVQMVINPLPVIDSIGKTPFQSEYCKDEPYELEAHVDENAGYPVVYSWRQSGSGIDSVTNGITLPGSYTYDVLAEANGCLDSLTIDVVVNPLDTVVILAPPSLCAGEAPAQLLLDPNYVTTGSWTDSLGTNNYITSSGVFDPDGLPQGNYKVIFTSNGACPGSDTAFVIITDQITFSLPDGNQSFCLNNNPDTLSINVNTGGGKFWTTSGEGISDDSLFVIFSRYTSGKLDSLYYGKSGQCGDTVGVELTLLDVDSASINSVLAVCSDEVAFDFSTSTGTTAGGTWSGNGITDGSVGTFDPSSSGPGMHTITYTTLGDCPVSDSVQMIVKPRVNVSIDSLALAFCGTASSQTATANIHLGLGKWETSASWPGDWSSGITINDSILTFNPNVVTPGTDSIFYMIDSSPLVCGDTVTLRIGISAMEEATITPPSSVCTGALP